MYITATQSHQLPSLKIESDSQTSSLGSVAADTSATTSDSISLAESTSNPLHTAMPTAGIAL